METFKQSCQEYQRYPKNLIQPDALSGSLNAYFKKLEKERPRLFSAEKAAVDFLDFDCDGQEPRPQCVIDLETLKKLLKQAWKPGSSDPQCRYIFIHAAHSRDHLKISHEMLTFVFSYHQVLPSFLDFVFPFGKQVNAQDFYFSGLREELRFDPRRVLALPQLGRSGKEIQICYNLRSVESSPSIHPDQLKWSIRQSALYHSFDIENGHSLWINVKGNDSTKKRISALASASLPHAKSRSEKFSASLETHLLLCDWSGENWRWYINDLEKKMQHLTEDVLTTTVDKSPSPPASPVPFPLSPVPTGIFPPPSRRTTASLSLGSPRTNSEPFSPTLPSRSTTLMGGSQPSFPAGNSSYSHHASAKAEVSDAKLLDRDFSSLFNRIKRVTCSAFESQNGTGKPSPALDEKTTLDPSRHRKTPPERPPTFSETEDEKAPNSYTFTDLQEIQHIEDKAQDALLHLKLNIEVLVDLRRSYQDAINHAAFPKEIRADCEADIARFDKGVLGVEKDLRMLHSRSETLLRLLADRKNLIHGILQYKTAKTNENFAKKAHESATRMELMTIEMHRIAEKTEQETVSMRVITTITLLFLPATFLATFMSTDILKFEDGKQNLQRKGLYLYLEIALPATLITFIGWAFYLWIVRKPKHQKGGTIDGPMGSETV